MEENLELILHGCRLARELQESLPNLANSPNLMATLCDEIVAVFTEARDGLISLSPPQQVLEPCKLIGGGGSSGCGRAVGANVGMHGGDVLLHENRTATKMKGVMIQPEEFMDVRSLRIAAAGVQNELPPPPPPPPLNAPNPISTSTSQGNRKRNCGDNEKIVKRVAAPSMGNLDVPPEDGYTWRKYGQKEIMNSIYPRSYYRCTHQKFYDCQAKKQVQRLNNDPFTFEVTYRGSHTCHMSSTAPSAAAPLPPDQVSLPLQLPPFSSPTPLPASSQWLSMQVFHDLAGVSSSSSMVGAGSSSLPEYRFHDHFQLPVVDLADSMFNSNSSSSNSMDLIFSQSIEDTEIFFKKNI